MPQVMLIGETARPYDLNAKELKWLCARGTKGKDKGFRFIVRHSAIQIANTQELELTHRLHRRRKFSTCRSRTTRRS